MNAPRELRNALHQVEGIVQTFVSDYELDSGDGAYYMPTDNERALITDAINGLLANDDFVDALHKWQRLAHDR